MVLLAGSSLLPEPDGSGPEPAAALRRRARPGRGSGARGGGRPQALDAALGPDSVLEPRIEHRLPDDQRESGNGCGQAPVSRGLPRPALPDPRRRDDAPAGVDLGEQGVQ